MVNRIIRKFVKIKNGFCVFNLLEFTDILKNDSSQGGDEILVYFDVCLLFPSVPLLRLW